MRFAKLTCLYAVLLSLLLVHGCHKSEKNRGEVIAVVDGQQLTVNDLLEDIPVQIRSDLKVQEVREFVLQWINNEVLYQESLSLKLNERKDLQRQLQEAWDALAYFSNMDYTVALQRHQEWMEDKHDFEGSS